VRDEGKLEELTNEASNSERNPLMSIPSGGISSFEVFTYIKEHNKTFLDILDILENKNLNGFSHDLNIAKYVEVAIYKMLSE